MHIGGFQKMTMLDFPGKVACTIFTYGCNFRCPFCHNASLVTDAPEFFSEDEVLSYLSKRAGILDGVCISGGEPLLQKDIFEFIKKVKDKGLLVKLDTNGAFPDKLKYSIDEGLVDYVAMDIKNSKEKYGSTVGVDDFDITPIEKSVEILLSGKIDFEFRTTITRELHTEDDIRKIVSWIKGAPKYFLQNFENTGNLIKDGFHAHDIDTLKGFEKLLEGNFSQIGVRGI